MKLFLGGHVTHTPQLTLCLKIQEPLLKEALQELLSQAGIFLKNDVQECEGCLFDHCDPGNLLPSLDFSRLPQPLRFLDLLSLLDNLPYTQEIRISHYALDLREKVLKNQKTLEEQRLTEKECQILRFFHFHKGNELSKDKILKEIWSYHPETETHTLETHIYRLRQKLEEDPNAPQILLNGKRGYLIK